MVVFKLLTSSAFFSIATAITCTPDFYDPKFLLCENIPITFDGWDSLDFCSGESAYPTKLKLKLDIASDETFDDTVSDNISQILNASFKQNASPDFCLGSVTELTLSNFRKGFTNALAEGTNLKKIVLTGTHMQSLPCDLFENSQVAEFHVKSSNIANLNKCVFRNSPVDFSGFSLDQSDCERITDDTFEYVPNLEVLSMSQNNIYEVDMKILKKVPALKVLDLSNNGITNLSPTFFRHNPELGKLIMNDNNLAELPCGLFQQNIKLKTLNLTRNALSKLPCDLIERQGMFLTELDLSENLLHKKYAKDYSGARGALYKFFKKSVNAAATGKQEQQLGEVCAVCEKKIGTRKKHILKNKAQDAVEAAMEIVQMKRR